MWWAGVVTAERFDIWIPAILRSENFSKPLVILSAALWLTTFPWRAPRRFGVQVGLLIAAILISVAWIAVNIPLMIWLHTALGGTL
jgi:hypothetical protein